MKRLVICIDGTWNSEDQAIPTNVVEIHRAILANASDGIIQKSYYCSGVGIGNTLDHITGGLMGRGLYQCVINAYQFLQRNYEEGDELYFFGFSRGAFAIYNLSNLISCIGIDTCGLINDQELQIIVRKLQHTDSNHLNKNKVHNIKIKFLGLWEAVNTMGLLKPIIANLVTTSEPEIKPLPPSVENACHALALDEKRRFFTPMMLTNDSQKNPDQSLEQCWFPGTHRNIGGGYKDQRLSNIALHWIAQRAVLPGLELDCDYLQKFTPSCLGSIYDPSKWCYFRNRARQTGLTASETYSSAIYRRSMSKQDYRPEDTLTETDTKGYSFLT